MQWAAIGQLSQKPQRAMSHQILSASSVKDGSRRPEPPDRQHGYSERLNPQQWLIHSTDHRIAPELHRRLPVHPTHLPDATNPSSHYLFTIFTPPRPRTLPTSTKSPHPSTSSSLL